MQNPLDVTVPGTAPAQSFVQHVEDVILTENSGPSNSQTSSSVTTHSSSFKEQPHVQSSSSSEDDDAEAHIAAAHA